ncbi:MAG: methionine--tRNA ligase [Dehalococcoidia bacterium]|nr:methionine--tRNA ligase [Dehalococcoidia bacterium]
MHIGQIVGAYLPADIFARYHRAAGHEVLMVSGSDQHGTPITVRAEQEGTTPDKVVAKYHGEFVESWRKLGINFDLYTSTGTQNHTQTVHEIFLSLLEQGYIYKGSQSLPYCPKEARFLPDRYVEGTCPHCRYESARGDQCDKCGRTLNPIDLVGARCKLCGATPGIRDSEHYFLKLSAFQDRLLAWVKQQSHWRSNVLNFSTNFIAGGLNDRAITRDIEWGVTVPAPGFEHKRIYVWFEAVCGYLSASKEWSQKGGQPDRWKDYWQSKDCRSYYFIGKDNIPFHTIIWPAMLMGYGGLNLPYDVPANEFLTLEAQKISTSRNWAVWLPDYLARFPADPLRYYLSAGMPESSDADFSWREYLRRNNDELVATYGNLAHRILTFTYRNFNGAVPDPGELDAPARAILAKAEDAFQAVERHLRNCHFKAAIGAAMGLAQDANRYVDETAPWRAIKQNRQAAARALWTSMAVISCLKTALYPFLPFSSQTLHESLGNQGAVESAGWAFHKPAAGQTLATPKPLFTKLEDSMIEEEVQRLRQATSAGQK